MPKPKETISEKVSRFKREFGSTIFSADNNVLFCKVCEIPISAVRKSLVKQHVETSQHIRNLDRSKATRPAKQATLSEVTPTDDKEYKSDLCKALISANIPLHKLSNPAFKTFLSKWTSQPTPHESTLRKYYIEGEYNRVLEGIRSEIGANPIWAQVDSVTDEAGRHIGAVVVGSLSVSKSAGPFLLHAGLLKDLTANSMAILFNEALTVLWPQSIQYDKLFLLLTDGASSMVKAGDGLSVCFYNFYCIIVFILLH